MDNVTKNINEKIKNGFSGQKLVVLPEDIINNLKLNPLTQQLYFTHIGFFPEAKHHFIEREFGIDAYVLIYCVQGIGWYKTIGHNKVVRQGEFFVLPANQYHSYGSSNKEPWSIYFLHFGGLLSKYFFTRLIKDEKIEFSKERNRMFDYIYQVIDTGYSKQNLEYSNMALWHLLNSFLFSEHFKSERYDNLKSLSINNATIVASITFMQKNLDQKVTLKEFAKEANLSVSRFSNVFKEATGYTPNDYFIRLKIQKACQYLDLTDKRIKGISHLLGIEDPYYFSRLFKKIMGKSPVDYRKSQK